MLLLYLSRLKDRGEPVGLHQFLLGQVLGLHEPRGDGGTCSDCGQVSPCRSVLLVALLARFPVPWTPASLARALSSSRLWESAGSDHDIISSQALEWGDPVQVDPRFRAERSQKNGQWTIRTHERGGLQQTQHLADDAALCEYLLTHVLRHVFPYGWQVDQTWVGTGDTGALAARRWWASHRQMPYLDAHRPDGAWQPDTG
jgi:hypothetical protein